MDNSSNIIIVIIATIINSIVFGYVASNSRRNKANQAYLIFLTFIILYTIFDCIIIQAFNSKETKDIIVKLQAVLWMPLAILFLNFIYAFLKKQKDEIFNFFVISTIISIFFTLFSDRVLLGYKSFNLGTAGITGPFFLPILFLGIIPPAVYALYLILIEGKIFNISKQNHQEGWEPLLSQQLKILFFGSASIILVVCFNIVLDELYTDKNIVHLSSLSLSIQSVFLLPALIKYNFLNQPMETLGDELYLNSSDAVFIINKDGTIINLNKAARSLFNLEGMVVDTNIIELFYGGYNIISTKKNAEARTKTGHYVTIAQNTINRGNFSLGYILVIRDISPRKKAEKKLLKSEEAYKHVIESSSDIIYNTDVNGVVTYINPVFEKISGYKEKELVGIDINKLVAPDFQEKIKEIYFEFFNSEKDNFTTEIPCVKKNKEIIWLELNTSKIKAENKILEFSTISRDITERNKTEHKLRESEERYRQLVENSTEMIYKTDMHGNYTFVNKIFINSSGLSEEENLKMNCFEKVVEEYRNEAKKFYREQFEKRESVSYYELPCYIAENKIIWVGQYSRLELDEFSNIMGYSVTARDITGRKKAEDQLLQTTKELTLAHNVAGLGSFTFDIIKDHIIWSDELYKIYGRTKEKFIPTKETFFNEIVHPDSRQMSIEKVDKAINDKLTDLDYIHKTLMPSGEVKWFQAIIKIKYNKKNEATLINGTSQDITELIQTRINLEESELRLKKAQEIAKLGFWEENHKTGEIYWSFIMKNIFGIMEETKIVKDEFWNRVHSEDLEWMKTTWKKAEKEKAPYSVTFRIKLPNGNIKHVMEQAEFIEDSKGNLLKTIGTVIDMTELHKYQEELRQLSTHIQKAQEEERAHIAREVHDELGQRLTGITMDLSFLKSKINEYTPTEIINSISALNIQAEETIQIIRKISQELRPSILDDLGLISAIDWLKEQYNRRTKIHFTMDMPTKDVNINGEHATAVFRITQEALTNIVRHANAKNVNIQMQLKKTEILLTVKDDGRGINEQNKSIKNKTFGVFGMKERASSLGGKLIIDKNSNKGTTVKLTLPYKRKYKAQT